MTSGWSASRLTASIDGGDQPLAAVPGCGQGRLIGGGDDRADLFGEQ